MCRDGVRVESTHTIFKDHLILHFTPLVKKKVEIKLQEGAALVSKWGVFVGIFVALLAFSSWGLMCVVHGSRALRRAWLDAGVVTREDEKQQH
jgi:hypothetical protein